MSSGPEDLRALKGGGAARSKRMLTVREAVAHAGICKTNIHALISKGQIVARKFGAKTLIEAESLDAYLSSLPVVQPRIGSAA